MLRTKGEPGTGNIVEAVRHMRKVNSEVSRLVVMNDDEIMTYAKELGAPYEVLKQIKDHGRLPVVNFAGGVATPQDRFNDGIRSMVYLLVQVFSNLKILRNLLKQLFKLQRITKIMSLLAN